MSLLTLQPYESVVEDQDLYFPMPLQLPKSCKNYIHFDLSSAIKNIKLSFFDDFKGYDRFSGNKFLLSCSIENLNEARLGNHSLFADSDSHAFPNPNIANQLLSSP